MASSILDQPPTAEGRVEKGEELIRRGKETLSRTLQNSGFQSGRTLPKLGVTRRFPRGM